MNYTIQQVPVDRILPLRDQVLIQGTNRTSPDFDGDREETTCHYAVLQEENLIGCVSLMKSEWEGNLAYQLRGMAIDPTHQGQGIGRILLQHVEEHMKILGVQQLWCNARTSAIPFYEKHGWIVASDVFNIFGVCLHVKMLKNLSPERE